MHSPELVIGLTPQFSRLLMGPAGEPMEGRRHKRTQIQMGCWIIGNDGASSCCSSFDISESGISFRTNEPLPPGRVVTLQFYTHSSSSALTVTAEVIWSRADREGAMGLRFADISTEQLTLLKEMARHMVRREHAANRVLRNR